MADNYEDLARRQYDAFNERDIDTIRDLTHPEAELTTAGSDEVLRGPDGAERYVRMWMDGFPDGRITVDHVLATAGAAAVEFTGRGTHTGTLIGPAGSIPATGRSVTLEGCDVLEFRDDKIYRSRSYLDTASLLTQLGVMPAAQSTDR